MKHLINKGNYEEYALDYLEGNLTPEVKTAMDSFLIAHPEIKAEIEDLLEFAMIPEAERFSRIELLKKDNEKRILHIAGIAAAIIFLLTMGVFYMNTGVKQIEVPIKLSVDEGEEPIEDKHTVLIEEKVDIVAAFDEEGGVKEHNPSGKRRSAIAEKIVMRVNNKDGKEVAAGESMEEFSDSHKVGTTFAKAKKELYAIEITSESLEVPERKPAIGLLEGIALSDQLMHRPLSLDGVQVNTIEYKDEQEELLASIDQKLMELNKNIMPYVKFAKANGLLSESYEGQPISLRTITQALVPESFE